VTGTTRSTAPDCASRLRAPDFTDVLRARKQIAGYLLPTPLHRYPVLDEITGLELWVKHENHQPVGAFKVRGGVNLVSQLTPAERERGVITASTGNHGQSIAFAGRLFDVPVTVCVPEDVNPVKLENIRAYGAMIVMHGRDFDDARERCEELAERDGRRYIHSGDEPLLIAGVATETLEVLEQEPGLDAIVVPIGGGSGAAGACIVARALKPEVRVIGVQSDAAPAAFRSWQSHALLNDVMNTFAEGLASRVAFELPQRILWEHLDDFVLVGDDEIRAAMTLMLRTTRNLVEPAGAAPLAAVRKLRDELGDARIALICSGGNVSLEQLRELLASD
jgi:threonine dehydratase